MTDTESQQDQRPWNTERPFRRTRRGEQESNRRPHSRQAPGVLSDGRLNSSAAAIAAGHELCRTLGFQWAVVTLDRDGTVLVDADGRAEAFPAACREVCDVTGAGDTVLAVLGLGLASGLPLVESVRHAVTAAGIQVQHVGVHQVTREMIEAGTGKSLGSDKIASVESVLVKLEQARQRGEQIVFTNGCFDLLHVGHVSLLEEAKYEGVLVVGVNSDQSVRRLIVHFAGARGPRRTMLMADASKRDKAHYQDRSPCSPRQAV